VGACRMMQLEVPRSRTFLLLD